jgi:hypothetical protein
MFTPAQLRDRLLELGIDRDLRTLTDWRQKGLLPPLLRVSGGRGGGIKRFWGERVLDQAIAADWLLNRSGRAEKTLLWLWLAGYPVDAAAAQRSWIQDIERTQHRRQQAAKRFSGGFPGLGRSWWKGLKSHAALTSPWWRELPESDRERISNFLGETQEWLRDDKERDDDAYRYAIADLMIGLTRADRKSFYRRIDAVWADMDPASLFAITPYLGLVESMSLEELSAAHKSLTEVASALRHVVVLSGVADRVNAAVIPVVLMGDFLGTLVARILVKAAREAPELPLKESLSTLHGLVTSVQFTDIAKKNDNSIELSDRVRREWQATKK